MLALTLRLPARTFCRQLYPHGALCRQATRHGAAGQILSLDAGNVNLQRETSSKTVIDHRIYGHESTVTKVLSRTYATEGPGRENIWTVPNLLTGSRIVLTPVLGNLVLTEQFPLAAGLFLFAGFTDMMDGQIARTWPSQKSMFGTVLDPLADKFLISTVTITLTIVNLIPLWLTALIVARDIGLICASFWVRYISMDRPLTLQRFFNVKHATVEFKPTTISKFNTVLQLGLVWASITAPIFEFVDHPALVACWYVTGVTTVLSGLSYVIWREDTYTVLKSREKK